MDNEPHAVIYIELFMNPKPLWLWDFFNMENVPVMIFSQRFYKSFSKGLVSLQKQTLGHIKALISKEVYVMKSKWSIQKLIYTGMLAAMAGALMSLEFSVPMMPPFYKVDFSDVPSIMALFLFGPASAAWVEIIKILIKLITVGTNSMYVGELSNLIGVALFVIPLWIVYNKMGKNRPFCKHCRKDCICMFLQCLHHPALIRKGHGRFPGQRGYHGSLREPCHHQPDHLHRHGHHPLQHPEAGLKLLCRLPSVQPPDSRLSIIKAGKAALKASKGNVKASKGSMKVSKNSMKASKGNMKGNQPEKPTANLS